MPSTRLQSCLIGSTGLVGSNLLLQRDFDQTYHSRTIAGIRGRAFEEVVCAGARGFRWRANQFPEEDRRSIDDLLSHLETIRAKRFVLISTIDVYGKSDAGVDESYDPSADENHPYGANRRHLERRVRRLFPHCHIVRLPGLYGVALKKNFLFDAMHRHCVERMDGRSAFQWYALSRLRADLDTITASGIDVMNLFPAPVTSETILRRYFPDTYEVSSTTGDVTLKGASAPKADAERIRFSSRYDLRTKHHARFGSAGPYLYGANEVLADLGNFLARSARGAGVAEEPR